MFSRLFKNKEQHPPDPGADEQYLKLRNLILGLDSDQLDFPDPQNIPRVWGALIDIGLPELRFTVVSLADVDQTTSVYAGGGAARIGYGAHPKVAELSSALLEVADRCAKDMTPATSFPLPAIGRVRFYVFTSTGKLMADRSLDELDVQRDDFSLLYRISGSIITEVRVISEEWQKE